MTKINFSNHISFQEFHNCIYAFNEINKNVYILSGIGAEIWKAIGQHKPQEILVQDILNEYDVDKSTVEEDISSFLSHLRRCGLIEN